MNHYPRHIGDWMVATAHLTEVEECMYSRMIDVYYAREAPLPAELAAVCRLVRATSTPARKAVQTVLHEFFALQDDGWHQTRCDRELGAYHDKSAKARASAMVSVQSRQRTNAELRREREAAARAKGNHTDEDWKWLVDACGGKCVRCGSTESIERDHIVPIYQGGSHGLDNIQPLCRTCNASKGPENGDHRPPHVKRTLSERLANAQRTLNGRSANQEPVTNNQREEREPVDNSPPSPPLLAMPKGMLPSPEHLQTAKELRPEWTEHRVREVFRDFRDHYASIGQKRADWMPAWAKWVRNQRDAALKAPVKGSDSFATGWVMSESGVNAKGAELGLTARPGESWEQYRTRVIQANADKARAA